MFSVGVTQNAALSVLSPDWLFPCIFMFPSSSCCTLYPISWSALRWASTGLFPRLHPPGDGISTSQKWCKSGASKRTLARIFFIFASSKSFFSICEVSRVSVVPESCVWTQRDSSISRNVCTSPITGTLVRMVFHFTRRLAASIGNTAFLLPQIVTSPESSFHHFTINIGKK